LLEIHAPISIHLQIKQRWCQPDILGGRRDWFDKRDDALIPTNPNGPARGRVPAMDLPAAHKATGRSSGSSAEALLGAPNAADVCFMWGSSYDAAPETPAEPLTQTFHVPLECQTARRVGPLSYKRTTRRSCNAAASSGADAPQQ
jgi:hypothetical protein